MLFFCTNGNFDEKALLFPLAVQTIYIVIKKKKGCLL